MKKNLKKGYVTKIIDNKTVVVSNVKKVTHQLIDRYIKKSSKILVDYRDLDLKIGDMVTYRHCKKISRNKSNRVEQKLEFKR